jgi:hypothetical protein
MPIAPAKTTFRQEFPIIIMESRLPDEILRLLTAATDRLFGNNELAASLDYSRDTTTEGGKQVILFGDQHRKTQEFQDPEWQANKAMFMNYLATACRHYAFNLIKICAPWLTRSPEEKFQVIPRNVWAVNQHEGDYNAMHVHPGTNVSGVIYLKVPEQVNSQNAPDGCISFWSNLPLEPINLQFGGNRTIIPKVGDLFMFPSWLPHTVYPFRGPGERRIVSFNAVTFPDPQLTATPSSY